jgi:hypothetical protein
VSYTSPTNSTSDEVRFYTGDTNTNDEILTDAEIAFELTATSDDAVAAAYRCFRRILSKLTRQIDRGGPKFSTTRSQKFQHYKDAFDLFKEEHAGDVVAALWSEHSVADAESIEADSDYRDPRFKMGEDER